MDPARFEDVRSRLFGIGYRMLGSVEDAEDLVQETYLRWHESDRANIENAEAWLVSVVTRLGIDRLRRASTERAHYVGEWLPEPLLTDARFTPDNALERGDQLSVAFLLLLDKLSPLERAVLVLRDVFDYDYALIAAAIEKSEAATRQLLHRARERVQSESTQASAPKATGRELLQRFLAALERGDQAALLELLSPEVRLVSDGGGKVQAARKVILGADRVARFFLGVSAKPDVFDAHRELELNGAAGWVSFRHGALRATTVLECDERGITAFYRVLNPDKLKALKPPSALETLLA